MKLLKLSTWSLALILSACATQQTNPQATIYNVKANFDIALQAVLTYDQLPPCVKGGPKVCSEAAVTQKLQQASQVANTAINAAEATVRDPNFAKDKADAAIAAANQAVIALTSIIATLGVKQ